MNDQAQVTDRISVLPGRDFPAVKIANKNRLLAVRSRLVPADAADEPIRRKDFGFGESYFFTVHLRRMKKAEVWADGRQMPVPDLRRGSLQIIDQRRAWRGLLYPPFDTVNFSLSQAVLDRLAEEAGGSRAEVSGAAFDPERRDPTMLNLAHALLPAFERPHELTTLFADHILLAAAVHILATYCETNVKPLAARWGLALWQQRRAVEMMRESLESDIGLSELAASCGLSQRHFARSFKLSFGLTPHRWLMLERTRRAQQMLEHTSMSLAEIALACGFADQSHFNRVFDMVAAMPPGAWRRLQRS